MTPDCFRGVFQRHSDAGSRVVAVCERSKISCAVPWHDTSGARLKVVHEEPADEVALVADAVGEKLVQLRRMRGFSMPPQHRMKADAVTLNFLPVSVCTWSEWIEPPPSETEISVTFACR